MLVGALRFIDPAAILCEANVINAAVEQSRNKVILECMTDLSVKALQALTIIAFTYVRYLHPHPPTAGRFYLPRATS